MGAYIPVHLCSIVDQEDFKTYCLVRDLPEDRPVMMLVPSTRRRTTEWPVETCWTTEECVIDAVDWLWQRQIAAANVPSSVGRNTV